MRLLWLGTYERDYTRARVLMAGLRAEGAEVIECHRPLWELTRHKAGSFLSPTALPATAGRFVRAWAELALEQRRAGRVDAVVAGYPYMPDALPAWLFARGRRVPLVADALISLSDTLAGDRARVGANVGPGADGARHGDAALRRRRDRRHRRARALLRGALRRRRASGWASRASGRRRPSSAPRHSRRGGRRRCSTASSRRSTASARCSRPRACPARRP